MRRRTVQRQTAPPNGNSVLSLSLSLSLYGHDTAFPGGQHRGGEETHAFSGSAGTERSGQGRKVATERATVEGSQNRRPNDRLHRGLLRTFCARPATGDCTRTRTRRSRDSTLTRARSFARSRCTCCSPFSWQPRTGTATSRGSRRTGCDSDGGGRRSGRSSSGSSIQRPRPRRLPETLLR